jgi:hypothetical protein
MHGDSRFVTVLPQRKEALELNFAKVQGKGFCRAVPCVLGLSGAAGDLPEFLFGQLDVALLAGLE